MDQLHTMLQTATKIKRFRNNKNLYSSDKKPHDVLRVELKINNKYKVSKRDQSKLAVLHFIDICSSDNINLPKSFFDDPEPQPGNCSPSYVVNMLNVCQEHSL